MTSFWNWVKGCWRFLAQKLSGKKQSGSNGEPRPPEKRNGRPMARHPLDGAFKRIERANAHIAEAAANAKRFNELCAEQLVPQYEADTGKVAFRMKVPDAPGMVLPVSDAIHNLRSALDYVVFALSRHDSGVSQEGTQFPIEDVKFGKSAKGNLYGFDTRIKTYLKGLSAQHVQLIEDLQPYKGVLWTKTLRDISNPDKHRELVLIQGGIGMSGQIATGASGSFDGLSGHVFRDVGPGGKGDLYVQNSLAFQEVFADGTPVIDTLQTIKSGVNAVVNAFKTEF